MSIFFGKKIREMREKKGYSQREVAEACKVSQNLVHQWEHGKSEPNFIALEDLCVFLNSSPNELLGIMNTKPAPRTYKQAVFNKLYEDIDIENMSEEDYSKFLDMVKTLAKGMKD